MDARSFDGKSTNEQIGALWKYLDGLAQNDPEKYNEFIKKTLEDGKKEGLGPPIPQFVIQTRKVPKTIPVRDFFINACQWIQIPGPMTSNDPIKMVASDLREELIQDKICFTIDVAVNVGVMEQCLRNEEEKGLLIDLMIRYVEATNDCKLDTNYKIFDESYKGNRDNLLDMMCPLSLREAAKEASVGFSEEKLISGLKKMTTNDTVDNVELTIGHRGGTMDQPDEVILPTHMNLKDEVFLCESNREQSRDRSKQKHLENSDKSYLQNTTEDQHRTGNTKKIKLKKPMYTRRLEVKGQNKFEVIEVDLPGVTRIDDCDLDVGEVNRQLLLKISISYILMKVSDRFC